MMKKKEISNAVLWMKVLEGASMGWFMTTYVLFLRENGLSQLEANLVNVVFMTTIFLFDPITGWLGDVIGQRKIYLAGVGTMSISMLAYFFGTSFAGFALAEFIGAIGKALMSNALETWMINEMGNDLAHGIRVRANYRRRIVGIFPAIIGGTIGHSFGLEWPWILSAAFSFVLFWIGVVVLGQFEESRVAGHSCPKSSKLTLGLSWKSIRASKPLCLVAIILSVITFAYQPFNMFWTPIVEQFLKSAELNISIPALPFVEEGISGAFISVTWVGAMLLISYGASLVKDRSGIGLKGMAWIIFSVSVAIGVSSLIVSLIEIGPLSGLLIMSFGFLAHEIGRGALYEVMYTYRNRFIPDVSRTSINSMMDAVGTLAAAFGLVMSGLMTEVIPLLSVWIVSALILALLAGFTLLAGRQEDLRSDQ